MTLDALLQQAVLGDLNGISGAAHRRTCFLMYLHVILFFGG